MMGAIFAQHAPLIRDYPGAPAPAPAPPDPPEPLHPPQAEPITFSVVTRASLFGIVGSAISSTTLATVTCADAAMTIRQSTTVAGLTFSYAANVLSVAGTPTGPTRVHRVVISYVASDGSNTIRGSSEHEITIVDASEVLTIGTIAGITGRVGYPLNQVICTPSANFDANVLSFGNTAIRGLTTQWTWNRALMSGELRVVGTPMEGFGPDGAFQFAFIANQQPLGLGIAPCTIVQGYEAPAPAPAPVPAPPAPSPSPPPAPAPAPAPGRGPDPFSSSIKVLLHFDELSLGGDPARTTVDISGKNDAVPSQNYFSAPYCFQQVNPGLGLMQQFGYITTGPNEGFSLSQARLSSMSAVIPGLDGSLEDVSAECLIRPASVLWTALFAAGDDARFSPLMTYRRAADGAVIWSLGIRSAVNSQGRFADIAFVVPLSRVSTGAVRYETSQTAISMPIGYGNQGSYDGRFIHVAGAFGGRVGDGLGMAAWMTWQAGLYSSRLLASAIKVDASGVVQLGGDVGIIDYVAWWKKETTIIHFAGDMDEARITIGRYSALIGLTTAASIPVENRRIPFSNPYV